MLEDEEKLLTGAQAAEFLGVKAATLYAYASRGLIESMPAQSGRERLYRLSDLLKLRQSSRGFKKDKDSDTAVWTGPVIKSAITEIRTDAHHYRGENAVKIALSNKPFEEIVELLWETGQTAGRVWKSAEPFAIPKQLRAQATAESDYLDLLKLLLVNLEMSDPVSRKLGSDVFATARRLIVTMALTPGLHANLFQHFVDGEFPLAQTLLYSLCGRKGRDRARLVNCALVLCADHELNASALAARIAASCDASLYSCLLSALGTFSGTLHGSASRRAEDLIRSSMPYKSAKVWMKDYLRQHEAIPGFGTELYREGDPRARTLIRLAQDFGGANNNLARLLEIVDCVRRELDMQPNLDIGLAAISFALALPRGSGTTIFAISRTAGWIAHAIEQRQYGGIIRPRARYIGRST